jgi:hypothetical protein
VNARLVWVAFVWFAALLVGLAAVFYGSGSRRPPRPPATDTLARSINTAQQVPDRRWQWSVTSTKSAMHGLVVNVETFDVAGARHIAETIVEPRRDRFDVVLVYVHRVGRSGELAARRVEWSRRDGYVEVRYSGP